MTAMLESGRKKRKQVGTRKIEEKGPDLIVRENCRKMEKEKKRLPCWNRGV
jgi:hypothetical protein